MPYVTAKLKRTLKAASVVAVAGVAAMLGAEPFVALVESDAPLDSPPAIHADYESEAIALARPELSDSELEDRLSRPVERVVAVGAGDTLIDVLSHAGVEAAEASQAVEALRDVFNPRALKAGQKVTVTFERPAHGLGIGGFQQVSLNADPIRQVMARRTATGFEGVETKRQVNRQIAHFQGTIKSSLFESAQAAGVPAPIIVAMIRALSYDVDFQRELQSGDDFDVLFEGWYDTRGKLVRHGDMLYAAVNLSGKPIAMFRFERGDGRVEYFNDKGESIRKALLKTPVDGARISSGFGVRRHPILGFTKMHKGVDFAVPAGTPINAAGDGVVEKAGPFGAYGNYVRIRHGNGYSTAYAHMSRIAPGLRVGKRVNQGEVIGYVGSTGRSTGPHLHYELLVNNQQVSPMSVTMPTGIKLAGREMERFQAAKRATEGLLAKIPPATRIAVAPGKAGALTN